jgi:hypothetical protein
LKLFYEKFPANDKKDDESIQELVTKTIELTRIPLACMGLSSLPMDVMRSVTNCSVYNELYKKTYSDEFEEVNAEDIDE